MGLVTESCVRLGEDTAADCWSCDTARGIDADEIIEGAVEGGGGRFEGVVAAGAGTDVIADKDEDGVKGATAAAAAVA